MKPLFLLLLLPGACLAQTTLVAVRDADQVVLAADSKIIYRTQPEKSQTFCKIRTCGDGFIAIAGLPEFNFKDHHFLLLPVLANVCREQVEPQAKVRMLEDAATTWFGEVLGYTFKITTPAEYETFLKKDAVISFILIGKKNATPYLYARAISYQSHSGLAATAMTVSKADYDGPLRPKQTDYAFVGHHHHIDEYVKRHPDPWSTLGLAEGAKFLVNYMAVEEPSAVGLPVDLVRVTKDGPQWIQRKPECDVGIK
jgi:hypothetical protein